MKRYKLRHTSEQIYFQKSFIGSVREQEVAEKWLPTQTSGWRRERKREGGRGKEREGEIEAILTGKFDNLGPYSQHFIFFIIYQ